MADAKKSVGTDPEFRCADRIIRMKYMARAAGPAVREKYKTKPMWRQAKQNKGLVAFRSALAEQLGTGAAANPDSGFLQNKAA
ncbi:MAG TPA: hypothetical protein VG345_07130 [Bryobacteraceae bacterium]|nr:hypothetical protein [Bryobacteraceae bacterium]